MSQTPTTDPEDKRVVLITGGGTGIGAAIAERFAAEGYVPVVVGRRPGPIEEVAQRLDGLAIQADATDAQAAATAIQTVLEQYGRLDVVVANAGGHGFSTLAETSDEGWASSISVNLSSAFVICREAIAALQQSSGAIVIVSSLAGLAAGPSTVGYTTTKHALIGLMRSIARDYGPVGVRANAICPGWIRTPMADTEMDEFAEAAGLESREVAYAAVTEAVPLRRPGHPAEVAAAAFFLGTSESSYITGTALVIDGGATCVDVPTLAFERAGM